MMVYSRLLKALRCAIVVGSFTTSTAHTAELSGTVAWESRVFTQNAADPRQDHSTNQSIWFEPEWVHEWDDGNQLLAIKPYIRLDENDRERTHFDMREFSYEYYSRNWELRMGLRRVFWGVAEFQHLVDVINQTDLVDNIDGEDRLGQPMVNLALIQDWGTVDVFVMPFFRERNFQGPNGRLRFQPRVDMETAQYESSAREKHVDFAIRYSHYIGDWDFGISHFYGTSREPLFVPTVRQSGEIVLSPFYNIIQQTSIDLQATKGNWLWKLEALHRSGQEKDFIAMGGGFEYTFVGVFGSAMDIGFLSEYHFDGRGETALTIFQDDIAMGTRLAFNDAQSSSLLAGMVFDRDYGSVFANIEASRRLGDSFLMELESRLFLDTPSNDLASAIRQDDYIELTLSYNF